jgi:hypothetical protein
MLLKDPRKRLIAVLGVFIAFGVAALIFFAPIGKSAFPPLPQPNGYDVLARAAANIVSSDRTIKEMTAGELAEFVPTNRAAIDQIRRGLDLPSAVPVEMSEDWFSTHTGRLMNLNAAALAMKGEALLLYREGDAGGALNECLDLLRFSRAIQSQGTLIDFLIGTACEVIAVNQITNILAGIFAGLSAADCKRAAKALEQHEAAREPLRRIEGREVEWSRRTFGPLTRIRLMIRSRSLEPLRPGSIDVTVQYNRQIRAVRLVSIRLASHAFKMEHGRKPQTITDLVPEFLSAVPLDPVSHQPLELPSGEQN